MSATDVIETYVLDVVRLVPRRQRTDVATELRSLLTEELLARAEQSGRPADEPLALAMVREHGWPNEVAARYQQPWSIIDPADTTSFLRAAIVGNVALLLLSVLGKNDDQLKIAILAWLGLLLVVFGLKNVMRRSWADTRQWKPRDRDRANRPGILFMIPIAGACVLFYAAPDWALAQMFVARFDLSWAAYSPEFQQFRLPGFIGLWICLLTALLAVAIEGRWRRLTRRIDIVLNFILACLVLSCAVEGNIFQSPEAEKIAREVFAVIASVYIPCVGVMVYNEIGRIDRAVKPVRAVTPAGA